MATEKFFVFNEDGALKRLKGRIVRFLDNEDPSGSDKSAIRTSLEVSPDAEGLVQADVGTAPNEIPVNGMLGDMAYQSAEAVSMGTAEVETLEVTDKVDGSLGINTTPTATLELTDATTNVAAVRVTRRSDLASTYAELGTTGGSGEVRSTDNLVLSADFDNNGGSSVIQFKVDGTERALITNSGNLVIANGNLGFDTSGKGIDFGSTTTGTGTVSGGLLNDYEEGTWIPALTFGGGATGITYSAQFGYYTKIGDRVFVSGAITLTAVGSSTGTAAITGLPFTASNATANSRDNLTFSYANGMTGLGSTVVGLISSNTTTPSLYEWAASGTALIDNTKFTNSATIRFNGQYHV